MVMEEAYCEVVLHGEGGAVVGVVDIWRRVVGERCTFVQG
jgi:hypothetical protein